MFSISDSDSDSDCDSDYGDKYWMSTNHSLHVYHSMFIDAGIHYMSALERAVKERLKEGEELPPLPRE